MYITEREKQLYKEYNQKQSYRKAGEALDLHHTTVYETVKTVEEKIRDAEQVKDELNITMSGPNEE